MSLKFGVIPVTPFQQNCSLLVCETTGKAAVIDPGGDIDDILSAVDQVGVTLEKIFLTHGHLDHASAAGALAARLGIPIEGPHQGDAFLIENLPAACRNYQFPVFDPFTPDRWLAQGDTVQFGDQTLEVLHCPGHTPGHVVYFHRPAGLAFVGDVLFAGSIGRTDFEWNGVPYGDYDTLIHAIRDRLWPLGDAVEFIPGHGPNSTFGRERQHNPFVGDNALPMD